VRCQNHGDLSGKPHQRLGTSMANGKKKLVFKSFAAHSQANRFILISCFVGRFLSSLLNLASDAKSQLGYLSRLAFVCDRSLEVFPTNHVSAVSEKASWNLYEGYSLNFGSVPVRKLSNSNIARYDIPLFEHRNRRPRAIHERDTTSTPAGEECVSDIAHL
jgi:hypothetical protein